MQYHTNLLRARHYRGRATSTGGGKNKSHSRIVPPDPKANHKVSVLLGDYLLPLNFDDPLWRETPYFKVAVQFRRCTVEGDPVLQGGCSLLCHGTGNASCHTHRSRESQIVDISEGGL